MFTKSIWNGFADSTNFPSLNGDIEADVAVIGGGITGLSTAHRLSSKLRKVVVLEEMKVGGGTTSHSTGNLYVTIDHGLAQLQSKYNNKTVSQVVHARQEALDAIENNVSRYEIDCDFKRCPWYLYSADEQNDKKIDQEAELAGSIKLGLLEKEVQLPYAVRKIICLPQQAQFNPMRYVQGLAKAMVFENCRIFEDTRVTKIEEEDNYHVLHTPHGTVRAKYVVHATHTPKGFMFVQTLLGPYREYGVACRLREKIDYNGIFWGYYGKDEKYSTRVYERNGEQLLLVVGRPHKVGQAQDNQAHIRDLEQFARRHFAVEEVVYRWGGQHYRPADLLPYIGRKSRHSNIFIATGYSTDGLVYGTLAGMLITDLITGVDNPQLELFAADRIKPFKSAKKFVSENINVAGQYLKDLPGSADDEEYTEIANGEGKVIEKDGQKLAVCRTDEGKLLVRSAVCTHMACIVHWNNAEKSWDCPCHGTRFQPDGTILEGPAMHPLHEIELKDDKVEVKHVE